MPERDLLVASVACGLGCLLIFSGCVNNERCFAMPTLYWLTARVGRTPARWIVSVAGVVMILMGCKIIVYEQGWRPAQEAEMNPARRSAGDERFGWSEPTP